MIRARSSLRHRLAAAGVVALAGLALAGCSATNEITTAKAYSASDGVRAELGDITAENLIVLTTAKGAPAALQGAFTNRGTTAVTVSLTDGTAAIGTVRVDPATTVLVGGDTGKLDVKGEALRASIAGTSQNPWRIVLQGTKLDFTPAVGASPFSLASADRIELYLKPMSNGADGAMLFRLEGGKATPDTLLHRLAGDGAVTATLDARLTHPEAFHGRDWSESVRNWSAAGGTAVTQSTGCQASPAAPGQACRSVPTATPTRGGATVVPTPRRRCSRPSSSSCSSAWRSVARATPKRAARSRSLGRISPTVNSESSASLSTVFRCQYLGSGTGSGCVVPTLSSTVGVYRAFIHPYLLRVVALLGDDRRALILGQDQSSFPYTPGAVGSRTVHRMFANRDRSDSARERGVHG